MRLAHAVVVLAIALVGSACDSRSQQRTPTATASPAAPVASASSEPWRYPAAERVVAIGDVHGDLDQTRAALRLAGVIDGSDAWAGGKTVLVQTGDILDRGNGERAILDLFSTLAPQAERAGGRVVVLHGNHELMNAAGDFRYVYPPGFVEFQGAPGLDLEHPAVRRYPDEQRARMAALRPGGPYAQKIASHPVVAVVGDTVFAHGGVLPEHVDYGITRMNDEVRRWLLGESPTGRWVVQSDDSPVWVRQYVSRPDAGTCAKLDEALRKLRVARMVVGHTTQQAIEPRCDRKVWPIDVGISSCCGARIEVLEIRGDAVTVLRP